MSSARTAVLSAFLVLGACSSSSSAGPAPQGLVGTWNATKAEFVNSGNTNTHVDVVAQGTSVTVVLETSTFTVTMRDPRAEAEVTKGSWTASADVMTMTPAGMNFSWVFDMSLNGDSLSLTGGSVEFDFNDDGVNEQAKLNLALTRQR